MKVLLTGPCGRVGFRTLERLLAAGYTVRCFDTRDDFPTHPAGFNEACEAMLRGRGLEYEWVWGDIRDGAAVRAALGEDVDAVIHHAAMTLPTHCEEAWEYCWDVNYYGTVNIIDAMVAARRSSKLVYSSSVAVYGFPPADGHLFTETDPLPSTCTYAATKIASELAIRRSGLNYTIMRMASCPDSGAPQLFLSGSPGMKERLRKEDRLKMPGSPAHFVSNTDVNTAYLNALDNPRSDRGIFNIAGPADCRTTFGAIKAEMAAATGGSGTAEEYWGDHPYPQFYYDTATAEDVLDYMHTSKAGLLENMTAAVGEIGEFLQYYRH